MSSSPRREQSILARLFWTVVPITILVYLLRGFGIITFIYGGIISVLLLLSLAVSIAYGIEKTRRF